MPPIFTFQVSFYFIQILPLYYFQGHGCGKCQSQNPRNCQSSTGTYIETKCSNTIHTCGQFRVNHICTFLFLISNGFHYLYFTGWDGPRHSEKVGTPAHLSCFKTKYKHLSNVQQWACGSCLCVKVQSRSSWAVCQHCPGVGHHRGLGDALEFVSVDCSQRPLHLRSHCLQWIQICWVNTPQMSIFLHWIN